MKIKEALKKFWQIVWKDDSPKGWIISLIFIFIVIKFIFFPLLSLVTGTPLPLAIIESCSMYHEGNFFSDYDKWWENNKNKYESFGIDKQEFENYRFKKGFNKGDIFFVIRANPEKLKIGDTVIFNAGKTHPIIHRIVKITETNGKRTFSTIGDNNNGQLSIEKEIPQDQLVGKPILRIAPYIGWIKLIFFEYKQPQQNRGLCK